MALAQRFGDFMEHLPEFSLRGLRDDMLERCDLARESNSERELAQVESTGCFQRKLSSERVTRASVKHPVLHN
ncbi:hypothetical protein AXE77_02510 [Gardnerella vaginalis]|uniref:Uncharacterized protein n=1 Tax=Gardnerella vaginalis TaxID=2702 RepID=A0A3E1J1Z2_GARVA|nr:hypothetical protein AXE77_02510 [Gardnerella vaginalis]